LICNLAFTDVLCVWADDPADQPLNGTQDVDHDDQGGLQQRLPTD
jgi:hypothetical protein